MNKIGKNNGVKLLHHEYMELYSPFKCTYNYSNALYYTKNCIQYEGEGLKEEAQKSFRNIMFEMTCCFGNDINRFEIVWLCGQTFARSGMGKQVIELLNNMNGANIFKDDIAKHLALELFNYGEESFAREIVENKIQDSSVKEETLWRMYSETEKN